MRRGLAAALVVCAIAGDARADDPPPATPLPTQPHGWQPNKPLLLAGGGILLAGYATSVGPALPSIGGLAYRIVVLTFTLGEPCWFNESHTYLCSADHGGIVLALPVAGPFLFVANHPHDTFLNKEGRELSPASRALLYTSGGVQLAGSAVVVLAFALGSDDRPAEQRRGANKTLLMTGLITFATAYGEAFLASAPSLGIGFLTGVDSVTSKDKSGTYPAWAGAELAIPLAGPFIFAGAHPRDVVLNANGTAMSPTARTLMYASGAVQLAGAGMMLASLAVGSGTSSAPGPEVRVLPMMGPGSAGLQLSIARW